jgi:hypothetical protein
MAVDKRYYGAQSLDRAVQEFEREYGMSSDDFYALYEAEECREIPRFVQHAWASFHEDILRMTGGVGVDRPTVVDRAGQAFSCA